MESSWSDDPGLSSQFNQSPPSPMDARQQIQPVGSAGNKTALAQFASSMTRAATRLLTHRGERGLLGSIGFALRYRVLPLLPRITGQIQIARIFSHPGLRPLKERYPSIEYKYLRNYLSLHFPVKTRLEVMANHYRFLSTRVPETFFAAIFDEAVPLWEAPSEEGSISVRLSFPHSFDGPHEQHDQEGDLALFLCLDGTSIYKLAFTIAPGKVFGIANDAQVALIGCLQGRAGSHEQIKTITKTFHKSHPSTLLTQAAAAIAAALGTAGIVGISQDAQPCAEKKFQFKYDEFWTGMGASVLDNGLFFLPFPLPQKPLLSIDRKYRKQVQKKRDFLDAFSRDVAKAFHQKLIALGMPSEQPIELRTDQ